MKRIFLAFLLPLCLSLNALAIDKAAAQKQLEKRLQDFALIYFNDPSEAPNDSRYREIRNANFANFYIHGKHPSQEKEFSDMAKYLVEEKLLTGRYDFCKESSPKLIIDTMTLRWSESLNYGDARVRWGAKCDGQKEFYVPVAEERWRRYSDSQWSVPMLKPQVLNAVDFVNFVYVDKNFEEALKLVAGTQRWSRAVKQKNIQLLKESEEAHRAHALEKYKCNSFDVALHSKKGNELPDNNEMWGNVLVNLVGCKNVSYQFKLRANGTSLDWDQIVKMLSVTE